MTIIDTHLHLVARDVLAYPWLTSAPPLDRDWLQDEYAEQARPLGIAAALHMEVDVAPSDIERETAHVAALAQRPGSMLRGAIASCRPEDAGFPAYLQRVLDDPFVRGFRRVLHVVPDDLSERPAFRENIARLGPAALPFDLCVLPRQLPKAAALADTAGQVQFVLDHCGIPDIAGGELETWRAAVAEIAKRMNVAAKISGIAAYAGGTDWTAETLRPYVDHIVECFGWDRLVWGSDWPVCTLGGGLTRWVKATQELVAGASGEDKDKLFSGNARRIYRI